MQVLRFWEALWSGHLCDRFELYICAAALEHHRRAIMEGCPDFDSVLKFSIELSGNLQLDCLMRDAEALCRYTGEAGRQILAELPPLPRRPPAAAVAPPLSDSLPSLEG